MEKAYKFRLYPTQEQAELMRKTFSCACFVYNQTLAARKDSYVAGSPLSGYDCLKILPGLKSTYPWLKEVDFTALQALVLQMDQVYKNCFAGRKGKRKVIFPGFKAKHHSRTGYASKVGKSIQGCSKTIRLLKLGGVKAKRAKKLLSLGMRSIKGNISNHYKEFPHFVGNSGGV